MKQQKNNKIIRNQQTYIHNLYEQFWFSSKIEALAAAELLDIIGNENAKNSEKIRAVKVLFENRMSFFDRAYGYGLLDIKQNTPEEEALLNRIADVMEADDRERTETILNTIEKIKNLEQEKDKNEN